MGGEHCLSFNPSECPLFVNGDVLLAVTGWTGSVFRPRWGGCFQIYLPLCWTTIDARFLFYVLEVWGFHHLSITNIRNRIEGIPNPGGLSTWVITWVAALSSMAKTEQWSCRVKKERVRLKLSEVGYNSKQIFTERKRKTERKGTRQRERRGCKLWIENVFSRNRLTRRFFRVNGPLHVYMNVLEENQKTRVGRRAPKKWRR